MIILLITDTGCEAACALETEQLIKRSPVQHANVLEIEGTIEDACTLAYCLHTARRVLVQITTPFDKLDDLEKQTPNHITDLLTNCTYKVEGEVLTQTLDHINPAPFITQELIEEVAGWIKKHTNLPVSLSKPDITIFATRTPEHIYVGVDVGGPLAKQPWRIMLSRTSIKSTIAAAAVLYSGVKGKELIFDPFSGDGTIAIESALVLSQTSGHQFDKQFPFQRFIEKEKWDAWKSTQDKRARDITPILAYCDQHRDMKAVRINSKLAGVDKLVHSTRVAIDWADLKLEEASINHIITRTPQSGAALPERKAAALLDDFCNQAAYLLKKKGTMTCITPKPDEVICAAQKHKFTVKERRRVLMGQLLLEIITFTR